MLWCPRIVVYALWKTDWFISKSDSYSILVNVFLCLWKWIIRSWIKVRLRLWCRVRNVFIRILNEYSSWFPEYFIFSSFQCNSLWSHVFQSFLWLIEKVSSSFTYISISHHILWIQEVQFSINCLYWWNVVIYWILMSGIAVQWLSEPYLVVIVLMICIHYPFIFTNYLKYKIYILIFHYSLKSIY
jgi:hypothetical protein